MSHFRSRRKGSWTNHCRGTVQKSAVAGEVHTLGDQTRSQTNRGATSVSVAQADRESASPADLLTAPRRVLAINRRSLFRVPVALPVEIGLTRKEEDALRSTTLDISQGGARVLLPSRLDEDFRVRLRLHLSDDVVISTNATVRHCKKGANGYATGLNFGVLNSADSRALSQAMARHQRRLQPQVHASLIIHWTSEKSNRSHPATTVAISPGAIAMHTQDDLDLGDRLAVHLRTPSQQFAIDTTVVDHVRVEERNRSLLAVDILGQSEEKQLRAALQEMQDEGDEDEAW